MKSQKYAGELDMKEDPQTILPWFFNILEDRGMILFSSLIDCPFCQQMKMEGRTAESSRRTGIAVCL